MYRARSEHSRDCIEINCYLIKLLRHSSDDLRVLHIAKHFTTDNTWREGGIKEQIYYAKKKTLSEAHTISFFVIIIIIIILIKVNWC